MQMRDDEFDEKQPMESIVCVRVVYLIVSKTSA